MTNQVIPEAAVEAAARPTETAGLVIRVSAARLCGLVNFKSAYAQDAIVGLLEPASNRMEGVK